MFQEKWHDKNTEEE